MKSSRVLLRLRCQRGLRTRRWVLWSRLAPCRAAVPCRAVLGCQLMAPPHVFAPAPIELWHGSAFQRTALGLKRGATRLMKAPQPCSDCARCIQFWSLELRGTAFPSTGHGERVGAERASFSRYDSR